MRKFTINFLLISVLVLIVSIQFFSVFNSKSPYTSDSLFYKHVFYELQGSSFQEARGKVLANHKIVWEDAAQQNIFGNENSYIEAYQYYPKRIFYPLFAFLANFIVRDEQLAFIMPPFFSYLGTLIILFKFFKKRLKIMLSFFAIFSLIFFPPFILNMTSYMTDTLGLFLWILQSILLLKYLKSGALGTLVFLLCVFLVSLFNREAALGFVLALFALLILLRGKINENELKNLKAAVLSFSILGLIYIVVSSVLGGTTLLDSYQRIQNTFGLYHNHYDIQNTASFLVAKWGAAHRTFWYHLTHVWYMTVVFLTGLFSFILKIILWKLDLFETMLVSLSISTYLLLIIFPLFEYRFFLIVIVTIVYFAISLLRELLKKYFNFDPI